MLAQSKFQIQTWEWKSRRAWPLPLPTPPAVSRPGTQLLTRAGGITSTGPASVSPSSHARKAKVRMAPGREGRRKLQLILSIAQTEGKEGKRDRTDQPGGKELIL